MTSLTIQLTRKDIRALKARTGKRSIDAALKAWIANADPAHTVEEFRTAVEQSLQEERKGKGRRFSRGREAIRWLES